MRWGLLPPLTFTSPDVTIAGFLQPSQGIAGDAFDYGVTGRIASVAIFDAMGHGLEASRMANVAVGAIATPAAPAPISRQRCSPLTTSSPHSSATPAS